MSKETTRENEEYTLLAETRALQYTLQFPEHIAEFRPSMFVHSTARILFESINYLQAMKMSTDASAVAQVANKADSRVTLQVVKSILNTDNPPSFVPADRSLLVDDLQKAETRKLTLDKLQGAIDYINAPASADADFFNELSSKIIDASVMASTHKHATLITLPEMFRTYVEELEERQKGDQNLSGDLLLDKALVRRTAGGQIITIVGATGSGKSAYSLNLFNNFINMDEPSILITLEMDLMSTADRLAALRLGIPIEKWYDRDSIAPLIPKLRKEVDAIGHSRCELIDDPSLTLSDIGAVMQEFRTKHNIPADKRISVFIDLLTQVQDFARGPRGYSMAGSYELAVNAVNVLAKMQNACVFATVQYNREVDTARLESFSDLQETRPHSLNAIKNSHAIAERSRVVLSTWRPKYYADRYLPDAPETEIMDDVMEVTVLKQSQGIVGQRLNYMFDGPTMKLMPTANAALPTVGEEGAENDEDVLAQVHF